MFCALHGVYHPGKLKSFANRITTIAADPGDNETVEEINVHDALPPGAPNLTPSLFAGNSVEITGCTGSNYWGLGNGAHTTIKVIKGFSYHLNNVNISQTDFVMALGFICQDINRVPL